MIDSSLTLLFGRREATYSYNWPYDFFSLVEFGKVELSLEYKNNEVVEKIVQSSPTKATNSALTNANIITNPIVKKGKGKKGKK